MQLPLCGHLRRRRCGAADPASQPAPKCRQPAQAAPEGSAPPAAALAAAALAAAAPAASAAQRAAAAATRVSTHRGLLC